MTIKIEPICEQLDNCELYRPTYWGSKPWTEHTDQWRHALQFMESRDDLARRYNLEYYQPIQWDGEFENIQRVEVYRPYKEVGVPSYIAVIGVDGDISDYADKWEQGFFFDELLDVYTVERDSEQKIYNVLKELDMKLSVPTEADEVSERVAENEETAQF